MPLSNAGCAAIANTLTNNGTPVFFNTANAHIGVGDGAAAFDAAQTDLQAVANKLRKHMDAGYPTVIGNKITFRATFDGPEANFPWNEWGVFNASSGGTMLGRKAQVLGAKTSDQSWQFTVEITITPA